MAWPTLAARTKTWSTEILTASDLQGQFDLGFTYFNDSLNGSTGHGHTGSTNDGPKIPLSTSVTGALLAVNGGTGAALSFAIGDVLYASSSTVLAKLSPSSAGQALSSGGATTAPTFSGMTTQGDVEYHNGTTRTRLGTGTAGQILMSGGSGANPSWTSLFGSWTSKSVTTIYQAATDGFVVGFGGPSSGNGSINVLTDSSTTPTTTRLSYNLVNGVGAGVCCPIKKNDYYEVTGTGTGFSGTIFFISLGG